jgi:hypothetical protein
MKTIRTLRSQSVFLKNVLLFFSFLIFSIRTYSQSGIQLLAAYTLANGNPIDCTISGDQEIILNGGTSANNFIITDIVLDSASSGGANWDIATDMEWWSGTRRTGTEYVVCPGTNVQLLGPAADFINCFYQNQSGLQLINLVGNGSGVQMITSSNVLYLSFGTPNSSAETVDMHIYGYELSDVPNFNGNWSLGGNDGTIPGINFIGTTGSTGLMFKVNNEQSGYIDLSDNASFGVHSMLGIIDGGENVGIGSNSLTNLNHGNGNVSIGFDAMELGTYASNNVAVGGSSLGVDQYGVSNTALGYETMLYDFSGSSSTAIGNYSGGNCDGSRNVFLGDSAGIMYSNFNDKLVIGNSTNSELITGDFALDSLSLLGTTYVGKPTYHHLFSVAGDMG